jgi:hypothetical protein
LAALAALRVFLATFFLLAPWAAMLKYSSFLPAFIAAVSHLGLSPRPAQVSPGFSGLRYFGATVPPRRVPSLVTAR